MNRTTARMAVTVAGVGALTGLAVGAAHADEDAGQYGPQASDQEQTVEQEATGPETTAGADGLAPNYVLQQAPGLPIGDPVSNVFSVAAPAYGVLGIF